VAHSSLYQYLGGQLRQQRVTKLRASDGKNLGTFPVSGQPGDAAFDGANVWVTINSGTTVAKM
jgi:hypothetical protein